MFDYLMVFSRGHTVYFGEAELALEHFASIGYLLIKYKIKKRKKKLKKEEISPKIKNNQKEENTENITFSSPILSKKE